MDTSPSAEAEDWLARHAQACWRTWDAARIASACARVAPQALGQSPLVAYWRALSSFMLEGNDALPCLELAYQAHTAAGDRAAAAQDAAAALTICLIDFGAMDQVAPWLGRAEPEGRESPQAFWSCAGRLARSVLSDGEHPGSREAGDWLSRQLAPLGAALSPDERLIAAQLLVNRAMQRAQYAELDVLAAEIEEGRLFDAASPLMRARWFYTLAFAHYQIDHHERAETAWRSALELAERHGLESTRFLVLMALLRLLVDRGRAEEAAAVERSIQPRWGGGRAVQVMLLHQMRARLRLLECRPAQAHAELQDALSIADQACLSLSERASCHTDLAQVLIALDRPAEAQDFLEKQAAQNRGRDATVFDCLGRLLKASRLSGSSEADSRALLLQGLQQARELRYMMFMRLLPKLAAELCGLALRWQIEPAFVAEVIRKRGLPAPAGAGEDWPWKVWVRLLGGFELMLDGAPVASSGKVQRKPLELLQILCCARELALGSHQAIQMLWPDPDVADPKKNLEMTVQRLRRLLGDAALVRVEGGEVRLNSALISSDLSCRRHLIGQLEGQGLRAGLPPEEPGDATGAECVRLMARVLELSRGGLLPGTEMSDWLGAERRRCSNELVRAAQAAAAVLRRAGAGRTECELLEAALRMEPLAEGLALRLMAAYQGDGRIMDALRVSERLRIEIRRHGMTLKPETEAAMKRLLQ